MNPERNAEQRIIRFLQANPEGNLRVVVAYTSIWGLAWLHRHTQGRRVDLLIGSIWEKRFEEGNNIDRQDAMEFLMRKDVTVKNWYRKQDFAKSEAHMKAWLVKNSSTCRLLTGSANLTKAGLVHNYELMVEPIDNDENVSIAIITEVWQKAWDRKNKLLKMIENSKPTSFRKSMAGRMAPGNRAGRYSRTR